MDVVDLFDYYIEISQRPELFSQEYVPSAPICCTTKLYKRLTKPPQLRCAVCYQRALPSSNYCSHHYAQTGKLAKCAHVGCDEPAIGGMYFDAVGLSYCYLHYAKMSEVPAAKMQKGKTISEREQRVLEAELPGSYEVFERTTISLVRAEQIIHSWMHQLLTKIRLD